ncbi:IS66 family transposase [Desulfocurvibacter africanus]|uniref:IS66 family transposase n=1 Tax=Desulfocurvibacter africanus TaxID=873 RepID=UPI00040B1830|nr:transposase [Desulfocurvibacter africanus]
MKPSSHEQIPLTEEVILQTPPDALALIETLLKEIRALTARVEYLEDQLGQNSSNSNWPPSSDSLLRTKSASKASGKRGGRKCHKDFRQAMLESTDVTYVRLGPYRCGGSHFPDLAQYYTHQVIELPEIRTQVTHVVLLRGRCSRCGQMDKALVPDEQRSGFSPRLSSIIVEMAGVQKDSRRAVQDFCQSVLGVHVSHEAIQKVIDRSSRAITAHYAAIDKETRAQAVGHVDEISWRNSGALSWLWVLGSQRNALFMIHKSKSRQAFESLVQNFGGALVCDGSSACCRWEGDRQTCLVHLIRHAKGQSERSDTAVAHSCSWAFIELRRLCKMAHAPPSTGPWRAFRTRHHRFISRHADREDDAGRSARRLLGEMDNLGLYASKVLGRPKTMPSGGCVLRSSGGNRVSALQVTRMTVLSSASSPCATPVDSVGMRPFPRPCRSPEPVLSKNLARPVLDHPVSSRHTVIVYIFKLFDDQVRE